MKQINKSSNRLSDLKIKKYGNDEKMKIDKMLKAALLQDKCKVIVLDDDPTGIQTVHDVYVFTDWSQNSINEGFAGADRMFYILTDSRSFTASETKQVHELITSRIMKAAELYKTDFIIISRGDSTLRGHYPLETETIRRTVESTGKLNCNAEIIMPFFLEGNRYTIDDIHYVADGDLLIPAGQTEFAKDKTFGYHSSNLKEWIEEKTDGQYKKDSVISIDLESLRNVDINGITEKIKKVDCFGKIIVNAVDYDDVKVFCIALLNAMHQGKHFLFRTAASFPKIFGGVSDKPLLTFEELSDKGNLNGGLIVVGSHVKKTTEQLDELKTCENISFIEFNQHLVVDPAALDKEVKRVVSKCETMIKSGKTVTVYTRRDRFDLNSSQEEELKISVRISEAVTNIVKSLNARPSFVIAKGGITSSKIGVTGLSVKKALVKGQILAGIPVWMTGPESKFPGMPYIIFPGNVGNRDSLKIAVQKLMNMK